MSIGRIVGRYRIQETIARGGQAVVYLAEQTDLGRLVALKELGAFGSRDPAFTQRFIRESRVAGSLNHPNIVVVHDYFEHEGIPYIAMEYVAHGSLRSRVGKLALVQIMGVLEGVLAGLAHAAEHGIVHRDIKPENVMVSTDGRVKIADFGIARAHDRDPELAMLTASGMALGTPSYMAPEQALGGEISQRTDLFAVGAMTYEMLVGEPPFPESGDGFVPALMRLVNEQLPPLRSKDPTIDAGVAAWTERMLAKDPDDRFPGPAEAWQALEEHALRLFGPRWRSAALLDIGEPAQPPASTARETPDGYDAFEPRRAEQAPVEPPPPPLSPPVPTPPPHRTGIRPAPAPASSDPITVAPARVGAAAERPAARGSGAARPADPRAPWLRPRRIVAYGLAALMLGAVLGSIVLAPSSAPGPSWPGELRFAAIALAVAAATALAVTLLPAGPGLPQRRAPQQRAPQRRARRGHQARRALPSLSGRVRRRRPRGHTRRPERAGDRQPTGVRREPRLLPQSQRPRTAQPAVPRGLRQAELRLTPLFEYTQVPLRPGNAIPMLGNTDIVDAIAGRLRSPLGGLMIVTGMRGVGKTTVVERAVARAAKASADAQIVVRIEVAKRQETVKLLYSIVRQLEDQLRRQGLLEQLEPELRKRIEEAVRRTSQTVVRTTGSVGERSYGIGTKTSLVGRKLTASESLQEGYLPYEEEEVEADIAWIVERLKSGTARRARRNVRQRALRRPGDHDGWRAHVVVIIDELDKLSATKRGSKWLRRLLTGAKTMLTDRGVHFVLIGGDGVHGDIVKARETLDGLLDIGWHRYVPCIWGSENALLDALILDPEARSSPYAILLADHLALVGRGIPRRILGELNNLVERDADGPYLALTAKALARMEVTATVHRVAHEFAATLKPAGGGDEDRSLDRARMHLCAVAQHIVTRTDSFTADDVAGEFTAQPFDIAELLAAMQRSALLEQVGGRISNVTFVGDAAEAETPTYVVKSSVTFETPDSTGRQDDSSTYAAGRFTYSFRPPADASHVGEWLGSGRYRMDRPIAICSTGRVYKGYDGHAGEEVALKVYDREDVVTNRNMRDRFLRESDIALGLSHPRVLRARAAFEEPDGRLVLVTDLLAGESLELVVAARGALAPHDAVAVAGHALEALAYLDARGIARLDLTPRGIILDDRLIPTITKLGLAKLVKGDVPTTITQAGVVVATPAYAAPEQIEGRPVDIRADVYALTRILLHMLTGHGGRQSRFTSILRRDEEAELDLAGLPVSADLRAVLHEGLRSDPGDRYQTPVEMLADLAAVPEAR